MITTRSAPRPAGPDGRWLAWVPFLVGTLAMLAVGGYGLTSSPLHWDEGATISAAERSLGGILHLMRHIDGVLGPYYVFMKAWTAIFGTSDLALRLPALIATSLAVGVVAELARRVGGQATGVVAGLLCATIPILSFHGIQARPYGMVFLLVSVATLVLYRALERPSWRWWLAYGVCLLFAGFFHIIGLAVLAAHGPILLARWWSSRDRAPLRGLVVAAGASLAVVPLAWLGSRQRDTQLNWVTAPDADAFLTAPGDLAMSRPVGFLLFGLALASGLFLTRRSYLELLALVVLPPLGVLAFSVLVAPVWVPRYVMFVVGPMCIGAAITLTAPRALGFAPRTVAAAARAVAVVGALGALVVLARPVHESMRITQGGADTRSMAGVIAATAAPGDALVFGDYTLRPLVYHYLDQAGVPADRVPPDVLLTETSAQIGHLNVRECEDAARCLDGVERVWLVTSGMADGDEPLDRPTPKMRVLHDGYTVSDSWPLGAGRLTLLVVNPEPAPAPAGP